MRSAEQLIPELQAAMQTCDLHEMRMRFAWEHVANDLPSDEDGFMSLGPEKVALLDQWIYRFSRLQDTLGQKVVPLLLEFLAEEAETMPFIDRLGRLEKLGLLSVDGWLYLREVRNILTHEYPENLQERLTMLHDLPRHSEELCAAWHRLKRFILTRI